MKVRGHSYTCVIIYVNTIPNRIDIMFLHGITLEWYRNKIIIKYLKIYIYMKSSLME